MPGHRVGVTAILAMAALFLAAGPAHACHQPRLSELPGSARPGDEVRFTISGTESGASYALSIERNGIAQGTAGGEYVEGTFVMPDLGESRQVYVFATIQHTEGHGSEEQSEWTTSKPIYFERSVPTTGTNDHPSQDADRAREDAVAKGDRHRPAHPEQDPSDIALPSAGTPVANVPQAGSSAEAAKPSTKSQSQRQVDGSTESAHEARSSSIMLQREVRHLQTYSEPILVAERSADVTPERRVRHTIGWRWTVGVVSLLIAAAWLLRRRNTPREPARRPALAIGDLDADHVEQRERPVAESRRWAA